MEKTHRQQMIIDIIKNSDSPVSGTDIAKKLNVSRQIIVNDIAILRATNVDIISTNRGYVLNSPVSCTRVFCVAHSYNNQKDEMNTIVDAGGKILDVFIDHPIYGKISATMNIYSRKDVEDFNNRMEKFKAEPLSNITDGYHYHTVLAYSEEILDEIEKALSEKGFLKNVNN